MLATLYDRLHRFSRPQKQLLMMCLDTAILMFAVWAAYSLRLAVWFEPNDRQLLVIAAAPIFAIPVFIKMGLYRSVIRYVGEQAIWAVIKSMTVAVLAWTCVAFLLGISGYEGVPRSVPLLYWLVGGFMIAGVRFFARWILWQPLRERFSGRQVLIYGAGNAGQQLATALRQGSDLFPAGFIDDDSSLHNRDVVGLRVYAPQQLAWAIEHFDIRDVIVAESSLLPHRRKEVLAELQKYPVHVRVLPAISEIASGTYMVQSLRELDIGDLLGRPPVALNSALTARNIYQKTVLVTGAGGSIGAELCRQILLSKPTRLLLVDHSEYNLYAIHAELLKLLQANAYDIDIIPLLANVCDYWRMKDIFRVWMPTTVYHAAAYKHVPLVEANPTEGIRNNVFGTLNTARVAVEHQVQNFVLVSTDKAVRPTNVMGASKRLAEMVLQALSNTPMVLFDDDSPMSTLTKNNTCFSMVRFGNVLGSSGSVVPLFKKQIKEGGPITVTDTNVIRYFMTIPEAAQLVIQAGAMAEGGDVFILDMGEPLKIIDLAYRMVELSGLRVKNKEQPDGDIEIQVIGLRPGEKLYEELLIGNNPHPTAHPRIMREQEQFSPWEPLKEHLHTLLLALDTNDIEVIRHLLKNSVDGYEPSATIVDGITLAEISEGYY